MSKYKITIIDNIGTLYSEIIEQDFPPSINVTMTLRNGINGTFVKLELVIEANEYNTNNTTQSF